jgi:hypothetical protein
MPLWLINLLDSLIGLVAYVILLLFLLTLIYLIASKIFHKKWRYFHPGTKRAVFLLILLPIVLTVYIIASIYLRDFMAGPTYDAWAKKCGRPPIAGVHETAIENYTYATSDPPTYRTSLGSTTEYFCSFKDAADHGYLK